MTRTTRLGHAAVALAALAVLTACGDSTAAEGGDDGGQADPAVQKLLPDDFVDKGVFKVALFENAPPDAFKEGNTIIGWQADLARAVGGVFGVKTTIIGSANFDSLIPGLQAGRFDASFSSFYITPERLKVADFATVGKVGTGYAVEASSGVTVSDVSDLCGRSVATLAGSTFIDQLKAISKTCETDGGKKLSVQTYPNNSDGVLAVSNGRVDVFATSSNEMAALVKASKGKLEAQPLIYEPQILAEAFVKDSRLAPATVAAINVLIENGRYAEILKKYDVQSAAIDESTLNSPDQ